jgi:ADP-ribosylglycohydrolase
MATMVKQQGTSTMNTPLQLNNHTLATGDSAGPTVRSYWILEDRFAAGAYPGKKHSGAHELAPEAIQQLENCGIEVFINLTQDYSGGTDQHLDRYDQFLSPNAIIERFPIPDVSVPPTELMEEILECIDNHLTQDRKVYVHCWGGIGRAGTTIACWLIRHGYASPDEVIDTLVELRRGDQGAGDRMSPETPAQCEFVLSWPPNPISFTDRVVGCLVGGAVGDALGAGIEFMTHADIVDEFGPEGVTDIVPAYGLPVAITDDTQMALFTAEGLIEAAKTGTDRVASIWDAYKRWYHTQGGPLPEEADPNEGLLAISEMHNMRAPGLTCMGALEGNTPGTLTQPVNNSKGCGGVMRAAPAGLVADDAVLAYRLGRGLAALTHGHPSGWIAAGAFAAIICELVNGTEPVQAVQTGLLLVDSEEAGGEVADALRHAVAISEKTEMTVIDVEELGGGWTAEEALAISVACFLTDLEPQEQLLLAVNHSGDSDSTGSILGNLIGANRGTQAIPLQWCRDLEMVSVIRSVASELCCS